jgi:D-alanyl-D-alanine carboxypeptidase/D-alanyl-D-alanine-endopeptidase (penicillin-binding protein 4)
MTHLAGTRQVLLSGTVNLRASALHEVVAVDDPALFAAHALYEALLRRGITVRGRPMVRHRAEGVGESQTEGTLLAVRTSPPLAELLRTMVKVSQNLHAEMFLREVGLQGDQGSKDQGSMAAGMREMKAMLTELRIAPSAWVSEDASGLARNDEVTARAVTQLLSVMAAGEQREVWHGLLPIGGQDGTLSDRLCCTVDSVSIRAKTGSLSRAVALSGYAESRANGRLAFSILVNNFSAPSAEVRAWVDRLASTLVE